jgi:hypothetical protein
LGVTSLYDLINVSKDTMIEKIGEANGSKLYYELNSLIDGSKITPDYIIMGALGFSSIAHKKWQAILRYTTVQELYDMYRTSSSMEEFHFKLNSKIPNLGEVTSHTIVKEFPFFEKDIIFIAGLEIAGFVSKSSLANYDFKAQIRFTGIRNKQLSELLCNAGYDADDSSSVTKKTNILIVPFEGFSSSKVQKAPKECIIVPIDEFKNNMEKYIGEKLI